MELQSGRGIGQGSLRWWRDYARLSAAAVVCAEAITLYPAAPHLGYQRGLLELVLLQQEVHECRCHVAVPQQVLKSEHIWGVATRTQGPMAIAIAIAIASSRGTPPLFPVTQLLLLPAQVPLLHLCLLHPTLSAKHQSHRDYMITAAVVSNSVRIWACIFVLLALLERLAINRTLID